MSLQRRDSLAPIRLFPHLQCYIHSENAWQYTMIESALGTGLKKIKSLTAGTKLTIFYIKGEQPWYQKVDGCSQLHRLQQTGAVLWNNVRQRYPICAHLCIWDWSMNLIMCYYIMFVESSLLQLVASLGKQYIVWQEIFDNGLKVCWKSLLLLTCFLI